MRVSIFTVEHLSYAYINGNEAIGRTWYMALIKALWKGFIR